MHPTNRPYTITVRENGHVIQQLALEDPFITNTTRPRGLRAALAVLFHRYEIEVQVSADHDTAEKVLELNPDYLGEPGSDRRRHWNEQLERALANL